MALETGAEVAHADPSVNDGQDNEDDGDDGESSQRSSHSVVVLAVARLVHAHQLEKEVGECAEIEYDDGPHASLVLPAGEEGGGEQDGDRDWNGRNGQAEFYVARAGNNDEELDRETKEEEEIKLQEGDVDLVGMGVSVSCSEEGGYRGRAKWRVAHTW